MEGVEGEIVHSLRCSSFFAPRRTHFRANLYLCTEKNPIAPYSLTLCLGVLQLYSTCKVQTSSIIQSVPKKTENFPFPLPTISHQKGISSEYYSVFWGAVGDRRTDRQTDEIICRGHSSPELNLLSNNMNDIHMYMNLIFRRTQQLLWEPSRGTRTEQWNWFKNW